MREDRGILDVSNLESTGCGIFDANIDREWGESAIDVYGRGLEEQESKWLSGQIAKKSRDSGRIQFRINRMQHIDGNINAKKRGELIHFWS